MIILISNMPLGKESAHQNQNFRSPHPLGKQNVTHQTAPDPPPTTVWQENLVSNDGFFGLSLSVLRGGGQAGRMERHFDASERGGEGVQGVVKKSYRTW